MASFSVIIDVRSAARLLNTLAGIVFTVAAANMGQLVRICLSVYRIWEALAVAGLVHRGACTTAGHSTDTADAAYAADGTLLNAACLRADHVDASVVRVGAVNSDG